jgi:hypothetical protein
MPRAILESAAVAFGMIRATLRLDTAHAVKASVILDGALMMKQQRQ